MSGAAWQERGFERHEAGYCIERGLWRIARNVVGGAVKYSLYRGQEFHGTFPDAHEAAVHADTVDAGRSHD